MRIVSSLDELLLLPGDRRVNGMGPRLALQLEIGHLPRRELLRAQQRLNRLQQRCGCVAGAAGMFVALLVGGYFIVERNAGAFSWRWLTEPLLLVLAAFTLGFIAKMLALAITRWQFARECRRQHQQLSRNGELDVHVHAMGR